MFEINNIDNRRDTTKENKINLICIHPHWNSRPQLYDGKHSFNAHSFNGHPWTATNKHNEHNEFCICSRIIT